MYIGFKDARFDRGDGRFRQSGALHALAIQGAVGRLENAAMRSEHYESSRCSGGCQLAGRAVTRGLAGLRLTLRRAPFKQSDSGKIFLQGDLQSRRLRKPLESIRIQQSQVDVSGRLRKLRPR